VYIFNKKQVDLNFLPLSTSVPSVGSASPTILSLAVIIMWRGMHHQLRCHAAEVMATVPVPQTAIDRKEGLLFAAGAIGATKNSSCAAGAGPFITAARTNDAKLAIGESIKKIVRVSGITANTGS
jgi:hypothetical protein